jgi:hypothetical protein
LRFLQWIDGKRDDFGVLLFEFLEMRLVVGNLPNAVGSPDAAIKEDDGIFTGKIGGNVQPHAGSHWNDVIWKGIAGSQLLCHLRTPPDVRCAHDAFGCIYSS